MAAAALPLAVGGLPQAFVTQPSTVELVSYARDDDGSGDPADQLGFWVPRSRDVSSGSSSGGTSSADPDYSESVMDEIRAFFRSVLGKGSSGSGSAEAGPFSDSPDYWRKIYYDQAMAVASGAVDASAGQTAETTEDPRPVINNPAPTSGSTVETQSASPDSEPVLPSVGSEPIVPSQPDVSNSPQNGRSQPSSDIDSGGDPKAPKANGSSGK
ncbi:hypothetical protein [Pseudonocardia eucalypti]|uniref:hypothetical protein n=1 Tax=Pseudonocardia eucalypti TaxID=648755 RepID=UPI0031E6A5F4